MAPFCQLEQVKFIEIEIQTDLLRYLSLSFDLQSETFLDATS